MADSQTRQLVARAEQLLGQVAGQTLSPAEIGERSIELARIVLGLLECFKTPRDAEQAEVLAGMMRDPRGQVFTTLLADRAYRSRSRKRTVEQARYLLERLGAPEYLGTLDRLSLAALRRVGTWLPSLSGTAMLNHIRQETTAFILPAAEEQLNEYLQQRRAAGIRVNINHLGEAVLGEDEAARRVAGYVELLESPQVSTISVKISSIFSQLQPLSFEHSVSRIADRLRTIYRAALGNPDPDQKPKLVTLDMESYRDLPLTVAAFQRVLDEPEFMRLCAGLVLQAYLPDSDGYQIRLLDWARQRVLRGGSAIRVRVVKGANLALERVESELRGWASPIYSSKADVDANYKRLLLRALLPENAACAQVGIASHNLFDVCFGLIASTSQRVTQHTCFELLEGMANPLLRALARLGAQMLVYAPIVAEHEFPSAIAYLTRRLDENTSTQNYLAHSFAMHLDSAESKPKSQLSAGVLARKHGFELAPQNPRSSGAGRGSCSRGSVSERARHGLWARGQPNLRPGLVDTRGGRAIFGVVERRRLAARERGSRARLRPIAARARPVLDPLGQSGADRKMSGARRESPRARRLRPRATSKVAHCGRAGLA